MEKKLARRIRRDKGTDSSVLSVSAHPTQLRLRGAGINELAQLANLDERYLQALVRDREVNS